MRNPELELQMPLMTIHRNAEGKLHREDGPAIEWLNGDEDSWWLDGKKYTFEQWIKVADLTDSEKAELILVYG